MKKSLLVILAVLAILAVPAFANGGSDDDSAKVYVFASDATWPPMEFVDAVIVLPDICPRIGICIFWKLN